MKMPQTTHADIPTFLEAIAASRSFESGTEVSGEKKIKINIITNFTDDILVKSLTGLCVHEGITPDIYIVPYKQYCFELQNMQSTLYTRDADLTFVFLNTTPYLDSAFTHDSDHVEEVLNDLKMYCEHTPGLVVISTMHSFSDVQYSRTFAVHPAHAMIKHFNDTICELAKSSPRVYASNTNQLTARLGETAVYDLRGLYAFDQPYSNDFLFELSIEYFAYIKSKLGITRKCLVLDLDNTLWGGVIGEVGSLGIQLGPDYPGSAYVAFQKVLLEYYNQGVILAINSRNNLTDVEEVFAKNPHMVLKEEHFAAIVANWNTKAENMKVIAEDINIGLDSLVLIDDDPMNRDLVRAEVPEVLVPEFSFPPEEYTHAILNLNAFHTLTHTKEDAERGKMYAAERKRKEFQTTAATPEEYVKTLNIELVISKNNPDTLPRVAQMTQKTNQFNLTTKRYTESDINNMIESGSIVYAGDVRDKFGSYGIAILAIMTPMNDTEVELDTCLMSCRVMGRRVEHDFMEVIKTDLISQKYNMVYASYIPTLKNPPSKEYLSAVGGIKVTSREEMPEEERYQIDLRGGDSTPGETYGTVSFI